MDANQFVYWLKGITDTAALPSADQWAKIARKIEEVIAAGNQKPAPPNYPVMRGVGGLEDMKKKANDELARLVEEQYEEAAKRMRPHDPVMRGPGGSFEDDVAKRVNDINRRVRDQYGEAARKDFVPTYPTVIASAMSNANKETL